VHGHPASTLSSTDHAEIQLFPVCALYVDLTHKRVGCIQCQKSLHGEKAGAHVKKVHRLQIMDKAKQCIQAEIGTDTPCLPPVLPCKALYRLAILYGYVLCSVNGCFFAAKNDGTL
jgi:hypothetical protein